MTRSFKNISDQKFGRLTDVRFVKREHKRTIWEFACDCGTIKQMRSDMVVGGLVQSCGCMLKETCIKNGEKSRFSKGHHTHNKGKKWSCWMSEEGTQSIEKPVVQFDKLGRFIHIHKSVTAAARATETTPTNIDAVCKHRYSAGYERKTAKGFIWLFLDEYLTRFKINSSKHEDPRCRFQEDRTRI